MVRTPAAGSSAFRCIPGLVGPYLLGIPFEVLVLQSFFRQLPDELIEAAKMDGAGPWRIFFTLVLPLSTPPWFRCSSLTLLRPGTSSFRLDLAEL